MKRINRIKVVLAEKGKNSKWLAGEPGKDCSTISKWCTNSSRPSIEVLVQIAKLLEVDVKDLLNSSIDDNIQMVRLVK